MSDPDNPCDLLPFTPAQREVMLRPNFRIGEAGRRTKDGVFVGVRMADPSRWPGVGHPYTAKSRECSLTMLCSWFYDPDEDVCVGAIVTKPDADGLMWVAYELKAN